MCTRDKKTHLVLIPRSIPPTKLETNTETAAPIPSGSTKNITARRVGGDFMISSRPIVTATNTFNHRRVRLSIYVTGKQCHCQRGGSRLTECDERRYRADPVDRPVPRPYRAHPPPEDGFAHEYLFAARSAHVL